MESADDVESSESPTEQGLEARLAALEAVTGQIEKQQRLASARLARIASNVDALVRLSIPPALWPSESQYALNYRRAGLLSQNGEEGMLAGLLSELGTPLRRFVEIGCGDNGGNSGFFAGELGWAGLMVDRDAGAVQACHERFRHNPGLRLVCEAVTPENVNDVVRDAGLTGEIDYLSIDIDSTDYWVLEALDVCSPRALVLEYNAYLGPERAVTVARDADFAAVPKGYFGASLTALTRLAKRKGYRLLACEETGVNAFYLRTDLRTDLLAVDPQVAFRTIKVPPGRRREGIPRDAERVLAAVLRSGLPLLEV